MQAGTHSSSSVLSSGRAGSQLSPWRPHHCWDRSLRSSGRRCVGPLVGMRECGQRGERSRRPLATPVSTPSVNGDDAFDARVFLAARPPATLPVYVVSSLLAAASLTRPCCRVRSFLHAPRRLCLLFRAYQPIFFALRIRIGLSDYEAYTLQTALCPLSRISRGSGERCPVL